MNNMEASELSKSHIIIIDAIMGTGKSTYMINEVINKNPEKRFLVVVQSIDKVDKKDKSKIKQGEVGRYKQAIQAETYEPNTRPSKTIDLQRLISQGKNIVTTHALIQRVDEVTIDLLKKSNYTLIIDECLDVVHEYKERFSKDDFKTIINEKWAIPDENGFLIWNEDKDKELFDNKYKGRWDDIKRLCRLNALMCLPKNDGTFSKSILIWNMPVNFFSLFEQCYICTYLWNGSMQKSYFDFHNVLYKHMTLYNNCLCDYDAEKELAERERYFSLINLYEGKLNDIGQADAKSKFPLSKSWFQNNSKSDKGKCYLNILKRNTYNYFKNVVKTKASFNMYSVFKSFRQFVADDGYKKGFVSCNKKATNDYRHKQSLAYLINLFPYTNVVSFFNSQGIEVNQDLYSLSELLQWIWRSAIRDDEKINLYLPSERMRGLLIKWSKGLI